MQARFYFFLFFFFLAASTGFGKSAPELEKALNQKFSELEKKVDSDLKDDKKLMEFEKDREKYKLTYFKEAWSKYLKGHVNALYAQDLESPGTILRYNMAGSTECLLIKQQRELNFLLDRNLNAELLRIWLGDTPDEFFQELKQRLLDENAFSKAREFTSQKLELPTKTTDKDRHSFYLGRSFMITPVEEEEYISSTNKDKLLFSKEEALFLKSLERLINKAYVEIITLFAERPVVLQYMLKGHSCWITYRAALISFMENMKVSPQHIKLRFLCMNLSRLYFYKSFSQYHSHPYHEQKCLYFPPREYSDTYDCTIVRSEKKLTPVKTPSCYP